MSWVRIDDGAPEHPKLLSVGAAAAWLWVCGLAYCNRQKRRDGVIPLAKVKLLYPSLGLKQANALVAAGLWERTEDGFQIHDYHDYQLDAERAEEIRAARSAAGRLGGQRSAEAKAQQRAEANVKQLATEAPKQASSNAPKQTSTPSHPIPIPSHPVPTPDPERAARGGGGDSPAAQGPEPDDPGRETICPSDLAERLEKAGATGHLAEKLAAPVESIREEIRKFVAYWTIGKGAGQRRTAWPAKARQWVVDQAGKPGGLTAPGALEHRQRGGGHDAHEPRRSSLTDAERAELRRMGVAV